MAKISEGGHNIIDSLTKGHVNYVINTQDMTGDAEKDGFLIRRYSVENNVALLTSLSTVNALLNVLEEITMPVSTVDAEQRI